MMKPIFLSTLLLACLLGSGRLPGASLASETAFQEEPEPVEDGRADIAKRLKRFDALIKGLKKEREPDVSEAVALMDEWISDFGELGPKDQQSVIASLGRVLNIKRIVYNKDQEPQVQLYYAAAVALGEMGPHAIQPLSEALGRKAYQKVPGMLVAMAESLGLIGDPLVQRPLLKLLNHKHLAVFAAAAKSLGGLLDLPDKSKKDLFGRLLKHLVAFRAKVDADPEDVEAYQAWGQVSGALLEALESLSQHEERSVEAWSSWWKANKKKSWD